MKKSVWIVNQYATTPDIGMGGRHYYLSKELVKQGYEVFLIFASYHHLMRGSGCDKQKDIYKHFLFEGINIVQIKTPVYSNARDKKRILNWLIFTWRLSRIGSFLSQNPKAILVSSPSPFVFLGGIFASRKMRAKLIFEVRDIWPLTLIQHGGISKRNPLIKIMQWIEDSAYRYSDVVISNLPLLNDHIIERGVAVKEFVWIANGFDLEEVSFSEIQLPEAINNFNNSFFNHFKIYYTGGLTDGDGLEYLIDAISILSSKGVKDVAVCIVGEGLFKNTLINKSRSLSNIVYVDAQPKRIIHSILKSSDMLYLAWKKLPIYKFGIAPNKLPEYMFSGRPIVHSYSGSYDFVDLANAGLSIQAEDPQAIANAILKLKGMTQGQRDELGENGRRYAIENHDYSKLSKKLSEILD
jgi:glycosyltransferase involved in cell wall biosynthesis